MTENETAPQQDLAPQDQAPQNDAGQMLVFLAILAVFILWGVQHPKAAKQVILVMLGFGGIVMIHELGHFIVAKLGGINVQAFSIGFPPVVLGIRKLKKGWRFRFLPKPGEEVKLQEGDNETEYQIGLIPFGGFVKMLGQSDTGAADADDDPRSYANRPIWIRICVVSAGVTFNAIGAAVIFMILFMNGINLPDGEVGSVIYNSPAYEAGIRAGDEIIGVNGEYFVVNGQQIVDFTTVKLAPVLSSPGEPIAFQVKHPDKSVETIDVVAEMPAGDASGMRYVGINQKQSRKIDNRVADDPEALADLEKFGLRPGDELKAVENQSISSYHEFEQIIAGTIKPTVMVRVSGPADSDTMKTTTLPVQIPPLLENFRKEYDLANFASLVPQLRIEMVSGPSKIQRMKSWFRTTILRKEKEPYLNELLQPGDVLKQVGEVAYPTFEELRKVTEDYKDKELSLTIVRADEQGNLQTIDVTVTPKTGYGSDRVTIGFAPGLDMESSVVAEVLPASQLPSEKPAIPHGAEITAVAGQPVKNFYDIASVLKENAGQTVTVDYRFEDETAQASLDVPEHEPVHAEAVLGVALPLAEYTTLFEAANPAQAVQMGMKKVGQFIVQNYITLAHLIKRQLPPNQLMGPVGIVSISYKAAGYSLSRYLYFLGLISTALAVMNLLPLPVLDGGHVVLLLIEKITGRPINEKVLAPIMYVGLAMLLGLILWVSYNDVMRLLYS